MDPVFNQWGPKGLLNIYLSMLLSLRLMILLEVDGLEDKLTNDLTVRRILISLCRINFTYEEDILFLSGGYFISS